MKIILSYGHNSNAPLIKTIKESLQRMRKGTSNMRFGYPMSINSWANLLSDMNAVKAMRLDEKVVLRLVASLLKSLPKWRMLIRNSFLNEQMKVRYEELIQSQLSLLQR